MKVPAGMTEPEVLFIIDKLCKRYQKSKSYTFTYYDADDIAQECFIFALEGLEKYSGEKDSGVRPLENFLASHIRKRLLNLKRNKLARTVKESNKFDKARRLIAQPMNISEVDQNDESTMYTQSKVCDKMSYNEIRDIIDKELEVEYRLDFLKLLDGKGLNKFNREKVVGRIKEILSKYE